jgi:pre-mRNA-splicing factor SYF2
MAGPDKRKPSPDPADEEQPPKRRFIQADDKLESAQAEPETTQTEPNEAEPKEQDATTAKVDDRLSRFKALQARQASSKKQNLKDAQQEAKQMATNPGILKSLDRKHAFASHNLLKAETEAAGENFERKRAWDWTVEESERWDKRMAKKERHRQDVAFQDYTQDARKSYKKQMRDFKPDLDAYQKQKMEAIETAVANGGLELVETEDGELIAVDRDGSFYSTADASDFSQRKPDKAGMDRLVADLQKAEEARLKKRKERMKDQDDGDITYINLKNKQFNEKLKRFYDKYTADIRDSFERGTAV